MPNNPYPANSQLRVEQIADLLIEEQHAANTKFRAALDAFAAVVDKLHFPLGCPVVGYDLADIDGVIADWGNLRYEYDDIAADAAGAF